MTTDSKPKRFLVSFSFMIGGALGVGSLFINCTTGKVDKNQIILWKDFLDEKYPNFTNMDITGFSELEE